MTSRKGQPQKIKDPVRLNQHITGEMDERIMDAAAVEGEIRTTMVRQLLEWGLQVHAERQRAARTVALTVLNRPADVG